MSEGKLYTEIRKLQKVNFDAHTLFSPKDVLDEAKADWIKAQQDAKVWLSEAVKLYRKAKNQ